MLISLLPGGMYVSAARMKPPRVYTRGDLIFFGGIRRSTLLAFPAEAASSAAKAGGSDHRIYPWAYAHGLLRRRINLQFIT